MTYDKFYHRIPKDPQDMTISELDDEMEACADWERICVEIGQGIQSKENLRERRVRAELSSRYAKIRFGVNGEELSIGKYGDLTGEELMDRLYKEEEIRQSEMKERIRRFATSDPEVAKQREAMGWGKKKERN